MSEPRRMPGRFAWLLPLAVFVLVLSLMPSENPRPRKLPFNEMLTRIEGRQIVRAELRTGDNLLRAWTADNTLYESGYPPDYGTALVTKLRAQDISFNVEADKRNPWTTVAIFVLPLVLPLGFWLLLHRSAQKAGASEEEIFGSAAPPAGPPIPGEPALVAALQRG
jgi:ATP-dependent Zn protease